MIPEEAWAGCKPTIDHFRIFGCIIYVHLPDSRINKQGDRGEKCIFLRVSEHLKAYKMYNPIAKKIVISRDALFDKENTWNSMISCSGKQCIL